MPKVQDAIHIPVLRAWRDTAHAHLTERDILKPQTWDAMLRTLQAADIAGIRAFAVHAKDEVARRFYGRFDFVASPTDAMHLFVLLKDVRRMAGGEG